MAKEIVDGKASDIKLKGRNPKIHFDMLQMYFGEPYVIDIESAMGVITITQPTIGDIISIGEEKFYSSLNPLITNTTSYRAILWDLGIDWNELSDFELFCTLYQGIDVDVSKLIFDGLDISKFEIFNKELDEDKSVILYDKENQIEINEDVYFHISQYLRAVFNIEPEEKLTKNQIMKEWYINADKRAAENSKYKKEKNNSIQPIISACVNHPGFKYRLSELKQVGMCEFYDSVKRLQLYENATAIMKGMYSGFVDGSKIPADSYNFMKEI